MTKKTNQREAEIDILRINTGRLTCYIRGITPLIYNAMSQKAKQGLLYPRGGKLSAAEKQAKAKHDPPAEYVGSMYMLPMSDEGPTLLYMPAVNFKRALASAALDLGGAKRTQIDRLVWAIGTRLSIYGVPMMHMSVIRLPDINRTPDIRTRAILPEWCCKLELAYVEPTLNATVVANLLASSGLIRGVGDFRQEKGAGNFGQFTIVNHDDPDWHRIAAEGGREQQLRAVEDPQCYDIETEELFTWWKEELKRRGHKVDSNGANREETLQ